MRRITTTIAAFVALSVFAAPARAAAEETAGIVLERPRAHQGAYLGLGVLGAPTFHHEHDAGWRDTPWWAPGGTIRAGQQLWEWLDIGFGVTVFQAFGEGYTANLGHFDVELQVRPVEPLFIRLAVGFGWADYTRREKGLDEITGRIGGSYTLTAGYDFFLGYDEGESGGAALTPVVGFTAGPGESTTAIAPFAGLELTFYFGLPNNELDLPLDRAFD